MHIVAHLYICVPLPCECSNVILGTSILSCDLGKKFDNLFGILEVATYEVVIYEDLDGLTSDVLLVLWWFGLGTGP